MLGGTNLQLEACGTCGRGIERLVHDGWQPRLQCPASPPCSQPNQLMTLQKQGEGDDDKWGVPKD